MSTEPVTPSASREGVDAAQRLARLPRSRYMLTCLALISLGLFWDAYMLYSIGPLSTAFVTQSGHAGLAGQYRIPAALFLGTFLGAIVFGRFADRFGRGRASTVNLSVLAIGCLAGVFIPVGFAFLAAIFVAGLGTGAEIPLAVTYAQELSSPGRKGRASSFTLMVGFSGGTAGGLVAYWLTKTSGLPLAGLRISLLIAAVGSVVTIFVRLRVPESPLWLERVGRREAAEASLSTIERRVMRSLRTDALPPVEPVTGAEAPGAAPAGRSTLELLAPRLRRATLSAWFIELAQGFGSYGFTTFVPAVLYAKGYSLVHAIAYTAIIQCAYPVGCFLSTFVTDRIPRKWGMAGFYALNVGTGLAFYFARSPTLIVLFGFLTEMLIFIDGPLLHTYEAEIYPSDLRGRGSGASFSISRLGAFLAPLAATVIVGWVGAGSEAPYLIGLAVFSWLVCATVAATAAVDTSIEGVSHVVRLGSSPPTVRKRLA